MASWDWQQALGYRPDQKGFSTHLAGLFPTPGRSILPRSASRHFLLLTSPGSEVLGRRLAKLGSIGGRLLNRPASQEPGVWTPPSERPQTLESRTQQQTLQSRQDLEDCGVEHDWSLMCLGNVVYSRLEASGKCSSLHLSSEGRAEPIWCPDSS
ncbi:Hypothetical predicted protein [Marmota monax]|uniref:Uncharacterized protein n=1 Tax=Marmota monax TaxID=9995 RepID=A0A5E4CJ05_MARMO|nr:Hypothetical predicted protein [Marmota monax]